MRTSSMALVNPHTQNGRIVRFLQTGKSLTVADARERFGVQNLSARIHELRVEEGFDIYTTRRTLSGGSNRGRRVTVYSMPNA